MPPHRAPTGLRTARPGPARGVVLSLPAHPATRAMSGAAGRPGSIGVSPRTGEWDPRDAARVVTAVRHPGAPLSNGSPVEGEAARAATRDAVVRLANATWCRPVACRPAAPSARRDSEGTTCVAVRAHSTECRTGSTPGSPDQP